MFLEFVVENDQIVSLCPRSIVGVEDYKRVYANDTANCVVYFGNTCVKVKESREEVVARIETYFREQVNYFMQETANED